MAGETVTVVQLCGVCMTEVGRLEFKKENLRLVSWAQVWCPKCQAHTSELREPAGRREAIEREMKTYPKDFKPSEAKEA